MRQRFFRTGLPFLIAVILLPLIATASANAQTNLLIAQADLEASDSEEIPPEPPEQFEVSAAPPQLTLPDATEMALTDNRTLQLARQAVEIARAAGRSALAQFLPDLYTTYAYTRLADAYVISVPDVIDFEMQGVDTFFWGLTFTYPLYSGGQDTATERAGEAETQAAELRTEQAESLICLGVTSAYTGVLEAQAALEAARKSLAHLDEVLRSAQAHYDAGYLPLSDLLAVRVARYQTEQMVAEMERTVEIAQSALAVLIGAEIGDRWALAPVEYPEQSVPFPIETLWEWAIGARPEIKELNAQRESVEAQMDAVRSARRPRVNFQADYSRTGSDLFPSDSTSLQGMISIWWDLFDFGRNDELIAPLEEQLALLDIQQAGLETQIQQEVESALLNVRTQLGNLRVSREAMAQAEEAFRVARRRQEEGLGLTLEVLDAEARLAQTTAGHYHVMYEYYRGVATLARTVGLTTDELVALTLLAGGTQ